MKKTKFKKQMIAEFEKQISDFIDNAGHIGKVTEVIKVDNGEFTFKYENPLQNNIINGGRIRIEMYN